LEKISGEKRFEYLSIYLPLYRAGLKGDWQATKAILERYPDAVRVPINQDNQNILHLAAGTKRSTFVKDLLKWTTPDDLELTDKIGNTALCYAAKSGTVRIAEEMVKINNKLPLIRGDKEDLPLLMASSAGNRDMVSYLFSATPFDQLDATDRIFLLCYTIESTFYGMSTTSFTLFCCIYRNFNWTSNISL
jgi:ankyrin repeat protein